MDAPIPVYGMAMFIIIAGGLMTRMANPIGAAFGWVFLVGGVLLLALMLLMDIAPDKARRLFRRPSDTGHHDTS